MVNLNGEITALGSTGVVGLPTFTYWNRLDTNPADSISRVRMSHENKKRHRHQHRLDLDLKFHGVSEPSNV